MVLAKKAAGPLRRRLLQVLLRDPEPLLFHAEPVLRDGRPVGYVRAASYGFTLGGAVADIGSHMRAGRLADLQPGEFGIVLGSDLARGLRVQMGDRVQLVGDDAPADHVIQPDGRLAPPPP